MLSSLLDKVRNYRVLLVGDAIIDEYVYVRPQGKSPKENIISNRILRSERFRGGVWAAAKHVEGFCADVSHFSGLPTITKRRYVEDATIRKLFEVHEEERRAAFAWPESVAGYDVAIITDFGHGAVTQMMRDDLTANAKFLAVNTQTNSANHGFNLITKYPRADYVVLDELEARLAAHDRDSPIENVIDRLGYGRIVVTLGAMGSVGYHNGIFVREPAVSKSVVDTMGAGDAFFCVTAPLAGAGADIRTLCRVGNAAGAIKCGVVGHREAVTRESLLGAMAPPHFAAPQ